MQRYLVIAMRTAHFLPTVIDPHRQFLDQLRQQGRLELAGPFGDKTGGAYLLRADSLEQAQALADSDPLHTTQSSILSVYQWDAH